MPKLKILSPSCPTTKYSAAASILGWCLRLPLLITKDKLYIFFLIGSWTVGQSAVHKNSMTGFFICSVVCLQFNENWFHYLSVLKHAFLSSEISQAARDHLDWPWCIKWNDESFPRVDLLVGLICYDQSDLGSHPDHLNATLLYSCRLITGV